MKTLQTPSRTSLGLAGGGLCGVFAPAGAFAYFVGELYLTIANMAPVPLLMVATFFGLRQVLAVSCGCSGRRSIPAPTIIS